MNEAKRHRWEFWTTTIIFLSCSAWFIRDYWDEPKFPFEPLIAFITYLFLFLGYFIFRKKPAGQPEAGVASMTAGKIWNIGKIKKARFSIYMKGGYLIALVGLLGIGIWQKDNIKVFLGYDRFFKEKDENFKILVLPFKQLCELSGKNYDAGYVLTRRLNDIARKENLKIKAEYWSDYEFEDYLFDYQARELQAYHYADMLIYGEYQTSDCSAEGDQICLNYVTDEKWNLGNSGTNFSSDYQRGGFDELKKGKLQDKVESIAVFISILAQIKGLDHAVYLKKLQGLLEKPDFSTTSKMDVYLELADKLREEGKLKEPLVQFEKGLQIAIEQNNLEYQCFFIERLGVTHTALGNLQQALTFFEEYNRLEKELHQAFPQNLRFKLGLAISYSKLGETHSALGNLQYASVFHEMANQTSKELYQAFPQNVEFKNWLAISYEKLGLTAMALGPLHMALTFFEECNRLENELYQAFPQNVSFKNGLAISYQNLGETHMALGNFQQALTFFEEYNRFSKELYQDFPQNVSFKNGLAISYQFLGATLMALGNPTQALTFLEEYSRLSNELHTAFPQNAELKHVLAVSYEKLGSTHVVLGNLQKALTSFEEYNRLSNELHIDFPQNVTFINGLALSYMFLGQFHMNQSKDLSTAKNYLHKSFDLYEELLQDFPYHQDFRQNYTWVKEALGK